MSKGHRLDQKELKSNLYRCVFGAYLVGRVPCLGTSHGSHRKVYCNLSTSRNNSPREESMSPHPTLSQRKAQLEACERKPFHLLPFCQLQTTTIEPLQHPHISPPLQWRRLSLLCSTATAWDRNYRLTTLSRVCRQRETKVVRTATKTRC